MPTNEHKPFELFGLTWQRRESITVREWLEAGEPMSIWEQLDAMMDLYEDPPREQFLDQTDVSEMEGRLIELWLAARLPPEEKNE